MAQKIPERIAELLDTCRQIDQHLRRCDFARFLPNQYANDAGRAEIHGGHYGNGPDARTKAAFAAIKADTVACLRAEGEADRDAELRRISLALHALRDLLPGMAAAAAIELGCVARDLAKEAANGSQS
jgi:hypothetical protein